jgi:hypothetical protein
LKNPSLLFSVFCTIENEMRSWESKDSREILPITAYAALRKYEYRLDLRTFNVWYLHFLLEVDLQKIGDQDTI